VRSIVGVDSVGSVIASLRKDTGCTEETAQRALEHNPGDHARDHLFCALTKHWMGTVNLKAAQVSARLHLFSTLLPIPSQG
jgi:hypothetical protein